jgi:hypothetical protein
MALNSPPSNPLSTPTPNARDQPKTVNLHRDLAIPTPEEKAMNPPPLPRSVNMTPARDVREGSVASSMGLPRKPRQNLDESDHILILKHCNEQKHNYKEGSKAAFWHGVHASFQSDTGKVLTQISATIARLVEARRKQLVDWENGVTPQKPGGRLNELLDKWIEYLRGVDGAAAEAPKRRVSAVPPAPVERMGVRLGTPVHPQALQSAPPPPPIANIGQGDGHGGQGNGDIGQGCGDIQGGAVVVNGQPPPINRLYSIDIQPRFRNPSEYQLNIN